MLQRALHGGVEVAAARAALGSVARQGGSSARKGGWWELRRDAWKLAGRRWHGEAVLHGGGRRYTAQRRRGRAEELEEGEKGRFEISKISRDLNVKQG